ncbi:Ribonuclease H-like superfamily protein [Theobroma cacao]|uniref:Ribonuclease H-like superfamily protein n=1 Tax=Theobroma cacao TaxID=3641 RepID=A0A061GN53_THECC|nr:Ribonuclease H-like superfamily protein [Theobroma cacao]
MGRNVLGYAFSCRRVQKTDVPFPQRKGCKRISNWKNKMLSAAGREILIKSVAQAIPAFCMNCFKILNSLCHDIDSVIAQFWWSGNNMTQKIHWKNWKSMCVSKFLDGMGFRDTKSFNLAMLAKQGWKLQLQVPTLAYKVLKERYFHTTDFLNALIGTNPSYLWRSIRESQQLIRIWRVSELIDQRTMTWNDVKITEIFPTYERELILSIPLSYRHPNDKQVWFFNRHGHYSVKSGYRMAQSLLDLQVAESSSCNMMAFWKRIWHLELPRKVILFLWKTLNGILPTRQALIYRSIISENNCPSCDNELETDFHCLCCCPLARAVSNFSKWGFTNIEIFQGKSFEPLQIIELAGNLLEQDRLVKGVRSRRRILQINRTCEWRAPVESKLNVDASIFELSSVRRMGVGFIVRNAIGEVELAGVRRMVMGQSVEEAELSALAWSLRCCQRENIMVKEIEMDCKMVVEWIKGRHLSGILSPIVEDCLNLMESINCVDILHCSREGNEVAHMIAKKAKEIREEAIAWFNIFSNAGGFLTSYH